MPISHYIRSYPSFPSVIPIHTASSLRVTHPSAMIPLPEGSLLIDLHVLSILSAFILSQDQTLHSIFISLHYLNFFFLTWRLFLLLLFSLSFLTHSFLLLTRNILPNLVNFVNAFFYLFFFLFPLLSFYPLFTRFLLKNFLLLPLFFLSHLFYIPPFFLSPHLQYIFIQLLYLIVLFFSIYV